MNATERRSGLANTVSPLSSTPLPSAPVQCATALPGKWPPGWVRVTPGRISSRPDQARIAGSGRATHCRSASATSTGTPPSCRLHSTWTPNMCGWLATTAATSPSSRTRRTPSASRYPIGSQSRFPDGVRTSLDVCPIPVFSVVVIPNRSGSSSATSTRRPSAASSSSVVQCCPSAGTHCRSSAQMAQTSMRSACSTAQVAQIQKPATRPSCQCLKPSQVGGNGGWAHHGRRDSSTAATHLTHQNPRRPGATSRTGYPCPGVNGAPPAATANNR